MLTPSIFLLLMFLLIIFKYRSWDVLTVILIMSLVICSMVSFVHFRAFALFLMVLFSRDYLLSDLWYGVYDYWGSGAACHKLRHSTLGELFIDLSCFVLLVVVVSASTVLLGLSLVVDFLFLFVCCLFVSLFRVLLFFVFLVSSVVFGLILVSGL